MPALADVLGHEMAVKLVKEHPSFVLSIRASVIRAAVPALEELLGRWVCYTLAAGVSNRVSNPTRTDN